MGGDVVCGGGRTMGDGLTRRIDPLESFQWAEGFKFDSIRDRKL